MLVKTVFDEIRVFEGVAERTGAQFDRATVRSREGCCRSVTEMTRKVRDLGDGYYYLPLTLWPAGRDRLQLHKAWVVVAPFAHSGAAR